MLHEAFHGQILRMVGLCAKALRQACDPEQHKNVVDSHASLAHLKDVEQQLVLNGHELALGSFMAGLFERALLSSLSKMVVSFVYFLTFCQARLAHLAASVQQTPSSSISM